MCDDKTLRYNFSAQEYFENSQVQIDSHCNGLTVINKGTNELRFNDIPLGAGESVSIGGNRGEILDGRVNLVFTVPIGLLTNRAIVVQKYYTGDC